MSDPAQTSPLYRIASLAVPEAARAAFFERAAVVRQVMQQQPGLIEQTIHERQSGPGRFNIVTIAAWSDQAALDAAEAALARAAAADGFDRAAFMAANGITAEIATFAVAEA